VLATHLTDDRTVALYALALQAQTHLHWSMKRTANWSQHLTADYHSPY